MIKAAIKSIRNEVYFRTYKRCFKINRVTLAANYLHGEGIEIGALSSPLLVQRNVVVNYIDRFSNEVLLRHFPNIANHLVHVDIIDDGEKLELVATESNDFVIANHFLEHCQNPALALENMLRVIKRGGVVFLAIPDKRYTFDRLRSITPMEHIYSDYRNGPLGGEADHYYDFVKNINFGSNYDKCEPLPKGIIKSDQQIQQDIQHWKAAYMPIHFHVWDHQAMLEMFCSLNSILPFRYEIEAAISAFTPTSNESIFIIRKV